MKKATKKQDAEIASWFRNPGYSLTLTMTALIDPGPAMIGMARELWLLRWNLFPLALRAFL